MGDQKRKIMPVRSIVGGYFMDVLFVNPDSSAKAYQGLAKIYSAIEPPMWALLLAESCRSKGFGVGILDCDAERLTLEQSVRRVDDLRPRLVVFVVYGQNPNSGTTSMIGALVCAFCVARFCRPVQANYPRSAVVPDSTFLKYCPEIGVHYRKK